jgi:hypothetical protein
MVTQLRFPVLRILSLDEDGLLERLGINSSSANSSITNIANRSIKFSGTNQATSGVVTFQVYGWTTNPLVEYYIIEDYTQANQYVKPHSYLYNSQNRDLRGLIPQ